MSKLNWPDNFVYKLLYSAPSVKIDYDNEFEKIDRKSTRLNSSHP